MLVQVVNLLVTPEQAEILNLATEQRIQLVLRNPMDTEMAKVPPTAISSIFSNGVPAAPKGPRRVASSAPKAMPQTYSIIVSNGSKTTEQKFAIPEGQH